MILPCLFKLVFIQGQYSLALALLQATKSILVRFCKIDEPADIFMPKGKLRLRIQGDNEKYIQIIIAKFAAIDNDE